MLNQSEAKAAIEALLFMATDPLKIKQLKKVTGLRKGKITDCLNQIVKEYEAEDKGMKLVKISNGYQFQTKAKYRSFIKEFHKPEINSTLSQASLETLSIVAYKQPVTRAEIQEIRGVNVEKALKTLQKRNLVTEVGRKDTIGNPIIYGTTARFLEYMGLENLNQLPPVPELTKINEEELIDEVENEN